MYERLLKLPFKNNKSFFLFGPRGTGKTTWIKKHVVDALYIDLLQIRMYSKLVGDPQSLENLIPENFKNWIILDEVQRVPELLNEVHRLIEGKHYKFILTGSSARKLRKEDANLLAGRALTYHLYPLTALEFGGNFNLEKTLQYGSLAGLTNEINLQEYLDSYINTYLREEVMQEGLARNIGNFSKFLEVASFSQGSLLNASAIAREVELPLRLVNNYFEILYDLLLAYQLPCFAKKAKRRLVAHSKFYYFDIGVYRTLRPTGPLDAPEGISGVSLESLFLQNLIAINVYLQLRHQIFFWRTSNGVEVDFVLYGEKGLYAFEIKRSKIINNRDFSGLHAFKKDYPIAKLYMIYGGDHCEYHGDVQVIPYKEALFSLPELCGAPAKTIVA